MTTAVVPFDRVTPNLGLITGAVAVSPHVDHLVFIDYRAHPEATHLARVEELTAWLDRLAPLASVRRQPNGFLSDAWNTAAGIAASLGEFSDPPKPWRLLLIDQGTILDTDSVDALLEAVEDDADVAFPGVVLKGDVVAVGAPAGGQVTLCPEDAGTRDACARTMIRGLPPDTALAPMPLHVL